MRFYRGHELLIPFLKFLVVYTCTTWVLTMNTEYKFVSNGRPHIRKTQGLTLNTLLLLPTNNDSTALVMYGQMEESGLVVYNKEATEKEQDWCASIKFVPASRFQAWMWVAIPFIKAAPSIDTELCKQYSQSLDNMDDPDASIEFYHGRTYMQNTVITAVWVLSGADISVLVDRINGIEAYAYLHTWEAGLIAGAMGTFVYKTKTLITMGGPM